MKMWVLRHFTVKMCENFANKYHQIHKIHSRCFTWKQCSTILYQVITVKYELKKNGDTGKKWLYFTKLSKSYHFYVLMFQSIFCGYLFQLLVMLFPPETMHVIFFHKFTEICKLLMNLWKSKNCSSDCRIILQSLKFLIANFQKTVIS